MIVITVNITASQDVVMKELIKLGVYASRSEIVRGAMHEFLAAELVDETTDEGE